MLKILHTSDWHLGRHLFEKERKEEHQAFLDWLTETLTAEAVDVLIVSGDIFDTGFPPAYALKQYYDFLRHLPDTPCRNAVITGGNHDGAAQLNAPKNLLESFNIHVYGGAEKNPEDEIVTVEDDDGEPAALICAIPFLRAGDLRKTNSTDHEPTEDSVIQGIRDHYRAAALAAERKMAGIGRKIPVIATGHLFASGCIRTDSMREVYVGNLSQIDSDAFPDLFDYIALGHFHNPRRVGGKDHIRYSGSPIPLSFGETQTEKSVVLVCFDSERNRVVEKRNIPCFRRLFTVSGHRDKVLSDLADFRSPENGSRTTPWAEVRIRTDRYEPGIREKILETVRDKDLEILRIQVEQTGLFVEKDTPAPLHLEELSPLDVFLMRCEEEGIRGDLKKQVVLTFRELLSEMDEESKDEMIRRSA